MDASNVAIGVAIHQEQDGVEKLLRFGSRCLSSSEINYCTTRKELLAVKYFMRYFRHYLENTIVIIRTDYGCLQWLKNKKNPSGQVATCFIIRPYDGDCEQCHNIIAMTDLEARKGGKEKEAKKLMDNNTWEPLKNL